VEETAGGYDPDVIGVVTEATSSGVKVATAGEVAIAVSTFNGPIKKGDHLTSSPVAGVAMRATQAGMAVGVALEDFDGTQVGSEDLPLPPSTSQPELENADTDLENPEASGSAELTLEQQVLAMKKALDEAVRSRETPRMGVISVLVKPGVVLPRPPCELTDLVCRSEYFEHLIDVAASPASATAFDGYIAATVVHDLVVSGTLTVGSITLTDNAGTGMIARGEKEAVVESSSVSDKSVIQITFESDYAPATRYFITAKDTGKSFTVSLDLPVDQDVTFSWWILENQNAKARIHSPTPTLIPQPTLIISPVPSVTPVVSSMQDQQEATTSAMPTVTPTVVPSLPPTPTPTPKDSNIISPLPD
jgi:hypothetical protein